MRAHLGKDREVGGYRGHALLGQGVRGYLGEERETPGKREKTYLGGLRTFSGRRVRYLGW